MLEDLYIDQKNHGQHHDGFLARDLIRFFVVDIILIIAMKLMLFLGVVADPDTHVIVILTGKAVLLAYLVWLIRDRRDAWPETGAATAGRWWGWLSALVIYVIAYQAFSYVDRFNRVVMTHFHEWLGREYLPRAQDVMILIFEDILNAPARITLIVFVVLIGPFMEELAFRGIGVDAYNRTSGMIMAVILTSVLFGLYHFSVNLILPLSFLGLVFGIARVVSKTLWCAIFIHCLHNGLTLIIMAQELGIFNTSQAQ